MVDFINVYLFYKNKRGKITIAGLFKIGHTGYKKSICFTQKSATGLFRNIPIAQTWGTCRNRCLMSLFYKTGQVHFQSTSVAMSDLFFPTAPGRENEQVLLTRKLRFQK